MAPHTLAQLAGRRSLLLIAVLALSLGACSATATGPSNVPQVNQAPTPAPSGAAADPNGVSIASFAYAPATLTVKVGSTVTWTNNDTAGHTVTADDGSFGSKTLAAGDAFSHLMDRAGTYSYHCAIHSSMTATIVVQ